MGHAIYALNKSVGREPALVSITAVVDPSRWSQRKKNIVIRALTYGIASCGRDTARFVEDLVNHHTDGKIPTINHWWRQLDLEYVKPEKLEGLIAYTAAWVRLKKSNLPPVDPKRPYYTPRLGYAEQMFLDELSHGPKLVKQVPLPDSLSHKERGEFIKEYIIEPNKEQRAQRDKLIRMIENDQPITFTFDN